MFSFDFISDMHTDFWVPPYKRTQGMCKDHYYDWTTEQQSGLLVVGGDCSNSPTVTSLVLKEARKYYEVVVFVDGNHEHYVGRRDRRMHVDFNCMILRDLAREDSGLVYLDGGNRAHVEQGVAVVGCNAWYDFRAYEYAGREQQHHYWRHGPDGNRHGRSNDSRCIRFSPNGYPDKLALRQSADLAEHVAALARDDAIQKIVVVTHTVPHRRGLVRDHHQYLDGAYMNTVIHDRVMKNSLGKVKVWCYGHTHKQDDFDDYRTGVRFVNNARGYGVESNKPGYRFDGIKRIEI